MYSSKCCFVFPGLSAWDCWEERLTVFVRQRCGGRRRCKQQRGPRHERVAAPADGVARVAQLHIHVRLEVHATRLRHRRHEEAAQLPSHHHFHSHINMRLIFITYEFYFLLISFGFSWVLSILGNKGGNGHTEIWKFSRQFCVGKRVCLIFFQYKLTMHWYSKTISTHHWQSDMLLIIATTWDAPSPDFAAVVFLSNLGML